MAWAPTCTNCQASHNVLRAHAKAYRIYQSRYKNTHQGRCSLAIKGNAVFSRVGGCDNFATYGVFTNIWEERVI
jgi:hypothetical protein